jgi:hypothetical protein
MNRNHKHMLYAAIVAALLMGLVGLTPQAPRVATASSVDGYALYTWTNDGIIATTNGAGRFTADYGRFECYATADVLDTQTIKVSFESSANNSNWAAQPVWQFSSNVLAPIDDFADISADSTVFGITNLYGMYTRPVFTLSEVNPVTVTLRCVGKDRPGYDLDQQAGALEATD